MGYSQLNQMPEHGWLYSFTLWVGEKKAMMYTALLIVYNIVRKQTWTGAWIHSNLSSMFTEKGKIGCGLAVREPSSIPQFFFFIFKKFKSGPAIIFVSMEPCIHCSLHVVLMAFLQAASDIKSVWDILIQCNIFVLYCNPAFTRHVQYVNEG